MHFRQSGVFLAGFLFLQCSSTQVDKGFFSDRKPHYAVERDKQGRKQGRETWWYANGRMKYQAVNREGVREGRFMAWHENGKPWYEGYEYHGRPESTLTYWHPNGQVKSRALFRDGIQLERHDFDESGQPLNARPAPLQAAPDASAADAEEKSRLRQVSLQMWALRVRRAVESYWQLPKQFEKEKPQRAVATITVARNGEVREMRWTEKSPSAAFNNLAQQTFKRIKKLPPFPPQVEEETLEVQYEFLSQGKQPPRKKLEARDPSPESEEVSGE